MNRINAKDAPADERRYPLRYSKSGLPEFDPFDGVTYDPSDAAWYGHDGLTLAWFEYADGSVGQDWRRVGLAGGLAAEYATAIVFRKKEG